MMTVFFASNIHVTETSPVRWHVRTRWNEFELDVPGMPEGLVGSLADKLLPEKELLRLLGSSADPVAAATFFFNMRRLGKLGLLAFAVSDPEIGVVARLLPIANGQVYVEDRAVTSKERVRISRLAHVLFADGLMRLTGGAGSCTVELTHPAAVTLLPSLAKGCRVEELSTTVASMTTATVYELVQLFFAAGVLTRLDAHDKAAEDMDETIALWELHDLMFHNRSRAGSHDEPHGATYPFVGRVEPLPAVRAYSGERIRLRPPEDILGGAGAVPFAHVLETRKSRRHFDNTPLAADVLSEFLFRTSRIKAEFPRDPMNPRSYESTSRPYPSGGASYDLETYLVVRACDGVPEGVYVYAVNEHTLVRISEFTHLAKHLLTEALMSTGGTDLAPVLIVLVSRFQRLAWKYRGISYATTLKNVGVLVQTMYLVATSMGLAACAVGSGNSRLFGQLANLEALKEAAVGEFLLGNPRVVVE